MTEEWAELVRRGLEAFNRGDMQTVLALLDDDVEVYGHPDVGNPGHYRGREGYLEWMREWLDAWDEFRTDLLDVEVVGDADVLAHVHQHGRGKGSGIEVDQRMVFHFRVEEGRATRLALYPDRATALEDLGEPAG